LSRRAGKGNLPAELGNATSPKAAMIWGRIHAVAAFCAALQELTHKRVPLLWASTQNSLGNALKVLGERESGTARLKEAVAAGNGRLELTTKVCGCFG
jgi:hypothetical protein